MKRLFPQAGRVRLPPLVIFDAGLGGDREPGRHGNAKVRHLGQARALPAEQFFHVSGTFGFSVAEVIHIFLGRHGYPLLSRTSTIIVKVLLLLMIAMKDRMTSACR